MIVRANQLLGLLPVQERTALLAHCEQVELPTGGVLCKARDALDYAFFPDSALLLLSAVISGKATLGVGVVGREAMVWPLLAFGLRPMPVSVIVIAGGFCTRIAANDLVSVCASTPTLRALLLREMARVMSGIIQCSVCAHYHEVEPRLARWLLQLAQRKGDDRLPLTHQLLAEMLGVRRSAVTLAAITLQRLELIRYRRGRIQILSHPGLMARACSCYRYMADIDAVATMR